MLLLAGCKPGEENTPAAAGLQIEPKLITCPATGGDYTIEVNSPDGEWTATASASWIRVMPASGEKGTTEVRVKIDTNKEAEESQGKITFVSGEEKVELPVSRAAKDAPYLRVVSEKALNTPKEGGTYTVQVESNIKWSISSNTGWAKVNKGVTVNNDNITITVSAATTPEETEAVIVVKPYGEGYEAGSDTVYVTRGSTDATSLTVDPESIDVPENGGSYTINVSSTAQWRVYKSWDMEWVTFTGATEGNGSGSFGISVDAATSVEALSGIITIEEVRSDNYKLVKTQVYIERAGKAAASLSVTPTTINAPAEGGDFSVNIQSIYSWTARVVVGSFFSISAKSGEAGESTLVVTVDPATTEADKTGYIIVNSSFGNEQARINIKREGRVKIDTTIVAPYGGMLIGFDVDDTSWHTESTDTSIVKAYKAHAPGMFAPHVVIDVLPSTVHTTSYATVNIISDTNGALLKIYNITRSPLPDYICPALFTVAENAGFKYIDYDTREWIRGPKQVYFSPGNLQYQASTHTWRFAENQYDFVGGRQEVTTGAYAIQIWGNVYENGVKCGNEHISPTYSGWIDLFGWGTGNNPTQISENNADYSEFHEWGDNAISNGGNQPKQWRTLTNHEWWYLMNNNTIIRAKVNAKDNGLIIFPDDESVIREFFNAFNYKASSGKSISADEFAAAEAKGVVFLPPSWERVGNAAVKNPYKTEAKYWSSSEYNTNNAYYIDYAAEFSGEKHIARAVRLVQDTYQK